MAVEMQTGAPFDADAHLRELGLDDLRTETIRLGIWSVFGLAFAILLFAVFALNDVSPAHFLAVAGLLGTATLARMSFPVRPRRAALVVVGGLVVLFGAAAVVLPGGLAAPWLSVAVLAAGALLGWRAGAAVAALVSIALVAMTRQPPGLLPTDAAESAAVLCWASLFACWLISRPTRTALDWAWNAYSDALQRTIQARERQAELARLSKSLDESYYRLEQLNLELARARRSALEARRLKEQFAAAVSHELRTPLNLILGFCEMMVLSPSTAYGHRLPASYRGDLEAMYRNACHISALVDDILDLSQIDADRMALHREWTTLAQIVDEATTTVQTLFDNRELTLRVDLPDGLPQIFVDPTRIRQILINLLSNAARALQRGGVTIDARLDGESIVVGVRDTGPGIPPDEIGRVFDEFRQVGGRNSHPAGSGLGLTVSRRFAEMHGGAMWAESVLGEGSTFYLRLPLAAEAPRSPGDVGFWDDRLGRRVRGTAERRIAVIDQSGDVLRVFRRYLDGYQVVHVDEIAARAARGDAPPIHAVVLGAPDASQRWQALQATAPDLRQVPSISCTLHARRWQADELGVADYLVKPISRDQLRAAIRRLSRPIRDALVVDDEPGMLRLVRRMLRSVLPGCAVSTAEDGAPALAVMRQRRPDLVVLDLLLPGMDGYAVLDEMHADPTLADVPVVVVTARGLHDETVVVSDLGIAREGGLSVGEAMRWVRGGLDALLRNEPAEQPSSSVRAPRAGQPV